MSDEKDGESFYVPLLDNGKNAPSYASRATLIFDNLEDEVLYEKAMTKGLLDYYIVSRIQPGSIKGSMFTLTTAIVGAGIITVPKAILQVGIGWGILLFILGGFVAYFSVQLLVVCCEWTQGTSYRDLAIAAAGGKHSLAKLTQFLICSNLFGTSVGYLVGGAAILQHILQGSAVEKTLAADRNFILIALSTCIILPLSLFRSLGALRFTSIFAIGCIAYLILAVVVEYFILSHYHLTPEIQSLPWFNLPSTPSLLNTIPLIVFGYTCHPNVLPIYLQLQRPSTRRISKVMGRSFGLSVLFYLILGIFVILSFGLATQSNFLQNDYHQSHFMLLGRVGFSLAIVTTIPLFVHTLRQEIVHALDLASTSRPLPNARHALLTGFIVALVLWVAMTVDNIAAILGFLGATTNVLICYILPTYFFLQLVPPQDTLDYRMSKYGSIGLSTFLAGISLLSLFSHS